MMTGIFRSAEALPREEVELTGILDITFAPEDSISIYAGVVGNTADIVSVSWVCAYDALRGIFSNSVTSWPITTRRTATWVPCPAHLCTELAS